MKKDIKMSKFLWDVLIKMVGSERNKKIDKREKNRVIGERSTGKRSHSSQFTTKMEA